jgi:hypothetical protein
MQENPGQRISQDQLSKVRKEKASPKKEPSLLDTMTRKEILIRVRWLQKHYGPDTIALLLTELLLENQHLDIREMFKELYGEHAALHFNDISEKEKSH